MVERRLTVLKVSSSTFTAARVHSWVLSARFRWISRHVLTSFPSSAFRPEGATKSRCLSEHHYSHMRTPVLHVERTLERFDLSSKVHLFNLLLSEREKRSRLVAFNNSNAPC